MSATTKNETTRENTNHWTRLGPIPGGPFGRMFNTPTGPSMNFRCISGVEHSLGSAAYGKSW